VPFREKNRRGGSGRGGELTSTKNGGGEGSNRRDDARRLRWSPTAVFLTVQALGCGCECENEEGERGAGSATTLNRERVGVGAASWERAPVPASYAREQEGTVGGGG